MAGKNSFNTFLQQLLVQQGYSLAVDGVAGAKTRAALMAFQRRAGLPVTGTATNATLSALRRPNAAVPMPRPRPAQPGDPMPAGTPTGAYEPPPTPVPAGTPLAGYEPRPAPAAPPAADMQSPMPMSAGIAEGGNSPLADPAVRSYMPTDVRGPNVPDFGAAGPMPAYPPNLAAPPPLVSTMSPGGQAAWERGRADLVNERDANMRALQSALNAKAAAAGQAMGDPEAQRAALIRALQNPVRAGF